jgi:hypothetical protein
MTTAGPSPNVRMASGRPSCELPIEKAPQPLAIAANSTNRAAKMDLRFK